MEMKGSNINESNSTYRGTNVRLEMITLRDKWTVDKDKRRRTLTTRASSSLPNGPPVRPSNRGHTPS